MHPRKSRRGHGACPARLGHIGNSARFQQRPDFPVKTYGTKRILREQRFREHLEGSVWLRFERRNRDALNEVAILACTELDASQQ
ncbi:hypothetical protein D3C85_1656700 [compost metagenome]